MRDKIRDYYNQFKYNRLFKTTMKSYFIIACAVFLGYALVMVMNIYHAAKTQLTVAEQKMLAQAETTNDFILRNLNSTASEIFENEKAALDAAAKPYSVELSLDISELISEMKYHTSAIDKVYFFNLKDDCIYTGEHPVYNKENFPDKELFELISSAPRYTVNIPHVLKYEDNNKLVEKPTLVSLYKYSDTSCMAVFMDSNLFDSMVNTDFKNKNQSMTVLNSLGTVISSTDPELFGKNLSDDTIVQKILRRPAQSGHISIFGRTYCYLKSDTLNSLYFCSFRTSSLVVSYIWQFIVIILFAMLLILLYFISSIQMSMSIFRPFSTLREDVFKILGIASESLQNDAGTESELNLISRNLANIKAEYDAMQENEHIYSETRRNELVYNLIIGSYNYDKETLNEYSIRFTHPYNTLILLRLDNTKSIDRSNIGLIMYGLANAGMELLTSSDMAAYFTTFSDEYDILFLINHKAKNLDTSFISMLQKYALNMFNVTLTASYDASFTNIDSVAQSFRNVKYAMQYRIVMGHNSIINYSSVINRENGKHTYPVKLEKIIIREIVQKEKENISTAVNDFIYEITPMPYTYILMYTGMLLLAISAHINHEKDYDSTLGDIISKDLIKAETIEEIQNLILAQCNDAIISSSDVEINDKHIMIANSIEDYINSHYTDPNLSIDIIASYVNKSANYTRSIFKQNKGISISDYISKKRFDEVCRMLIETNLTAQTIGQKVGLNSGSYFYTAFKKYTGFTPEQYRKKYMKNE